MAPRAIHQLVPKLSRADPSSALVRLWQGELKRWGIESDIFALETDVATGGEARPAAEYASVAGPWTVLLVHHGMPGPALLPMVRQAPGRKAVVYHGLPPAHLFEEVARPRAHEIQTAREELPELAKGVERGYAFTRFDGEELAANLFSEVSEAPFMLDPARVSVEPDAALRAELRDGRAQVLLAGRGTPDEHVADALRAFAAYQRREVPGSRLVVAWEEPEAGAYTTRLRALAEGLGLERVRWMERPTPAQLAACYETSSVFLSMGGYGVGAEFFLVEAMRRGVPVVAYGVGGAPDVLRDAGLILQSRDPDEAAKVLAMLDRDRGARERQIERQRTLAQGFEPAAALARLKEALEPLLNPGPKAVPPPPDLPAVLIVAPALDTNPEHPLARAARGLAVALAASADVLILTLKADGWPAGMEPEVQREGLTTVLKYSPEEPMDARTVDLRRSPSLEGAVRATQGPVIFIGQGIITRGLMPEVIARAFLVEAPGKAALSEPKGLGPRRHVIATLNRLEEAAQAVLPEVLAALKQGGAGAG